MKRPKRGPGVLCPNCGRVNDYGERCECERLETEQIVCRQLSSGGKRFAPLTDDYELRYKKAMNEFYYA